MSIVAQLLCIIMATLSNADAGCQAEIQAIDKQIEVLTKKRDQHQVKATEYQLKGDRWQYGSNRIEDAYASWRQANAERTQMIELQRQIDALNARKERIYQYYPELRYPSS